MTTNGRLPLLDVVQGWICALFCGFIRKRNVDDYERQAATLGCSSGLDLCSVLWLHKKKEC
jgi:hypothetical protein